MIEQNVIQINGGIKIKSILKKHHVCEKEYVWNPSTCICENGRYSASVMDESVITCEEVIESYVEEVKTIPTNLNEKI